MRSHWTIGAIILALLIGFRCLGAAMTEQLPNFSPLPAIFLASVIFMRGKQAWLIPFIAWTISSPLASLIQGYSPLANPGALLTAFFTLVALGFMALMLRGKPTTPIVLGSSVLAAVLFHLVTAIGAWMTYPPYDSSLNGFVQAFWTGDPTAQLPSWVFLRNLVAANVLFMGLFLAAHHRWAPAKMPEEALQSR